MGMLVVAGVMEMENNSKIVLLPSTDEAAAPTCVPLGMMQR